MRNKIWIVVVVLFILAFIIFLIFNKTTVHPSPAPVVTKEPIPNIVDGIVQLKDGRQCYTYSHEATATEPYTTSEFIDITIAAGVVNGTKTGTQKGPDMTNGYTGTITGNLSNNSITDVYSYVVEGSANKEKEIYRAGKVGLEKLRYQLIEQGGMLVPDVTKDYNVLSYARVGCTASN